MVLWYTAPWRPTLPAHQLRLGTGRVAPESTMVYTGAIKTASQEI
jgi:hypothetical protein